MLFGSDGGTIGRVPGNDWVLPDQFVSSRHAAIQYADGQFYVIDTNSSNGVFLNDPNSRLERNRPYPLKGGDRLLIDPFEIQVSVIESRSPTADEHLAGTVPSPSLRAPDCLESLVPASSAGPGESVDPLVALGIPKPSEPRAAPRAADLAPGSPLRSQYELPHISPLEPPPAIPADYNPLALAGAEPLARKPSPPPSALPREAPPRKAAPPAPAPASRAESPPPASAPRQRPAPLPSAAVAARAPRLMLASAAKEATPAAAVPAGTSAQLDFAALLAAAGLQGVQITPQLSADFGTILRVVIDGVREVLRAREELKDHFRLKITRYARRENNPIKFSANAEDALHNLLIKRSPAYLEPVAAFEEAFEDLRIHQMAMLAGLRAGYEAMLEAFDPDTLEQKFERYVRRGGLLGGNVRQRYWELYRDAFQNLSGDTDATFRKLFGRAFSDAYETQARLHKRRTQSQ
jgi:type VI secretion system FHA domain protein